MSITFIGKSHRVLYRAKKNVSGLLNIFAEVRKPDLTLIGPFVLTELIGINFAGIYYFDLLTSASDPEGEYSGTVVEPTSGIKDHFKVSFRNQTDFKDLDSGKGIDEAFEIELGPDAPLVVKTQEIQTVTVELGPDLPFQVKLGDPNIALNVELGFVPPFEIDLGECNV